jgi:hypothetical protein
MVGEIVTKPMELVTDWLREPLRYQEAERHIKRETEIKRILVEIEENRKDREFERMKAVSEAILRYQQELTKLNVDAISAIGYMQLDLREKAQTIVYERTIRLKELQAVAFREATEDLKMIEREFPENNRSHEILTNAVDQRLSNIIDAAHNFLVELNLDIKLLNQSISILADKGQFFIERHLDQTFQVHLIDITDNENKRLIGK